MLWSFGAVAGDVCLDLGMFQEASSCVHLVGRANSSGFCMEFWTKKEVNPLKNNMICRLFPAGLRFREPTLIAVFLPRAAEESGMIFCRALRKATL